MRLDCSRFVFWYFTCSKKYGLVEDRRLYNASVRLVIRNFTREDAGQYKCVATNSLGRSDTSIRLYVIDVPSPK